MRYFLLFGSNLGDRNKNIAEGIMRLKRKGLKEFTRSKVYESLPWGIRNQPRFRNQVVGFESGLSPEEMLRIIKSVELIMGRLPSKRYGPRLIDIDILMIEGRKFRSSELEIPHSKLFERPFALTPLHEVTSIEMIPIGRGEVWTAT
ncbi:MAG TPA: 2-amino-4-hydroxy-6-hydroxymethyldihydropteridine diphosphokinase [bacterium (Candidatus Stahlbacteria)]|nr:2-amino-4-hydroxy-6-hydroxymethyldihydropteridine diphosphokinase [Candidatus Stahlbacteria bacterium]